MKNSWDWFCYWCVKKIPVRKIDGWERTDGYEYKSKHYCKKCYEEIIKGEEDE